MRNILLVARRELEAGVVKKSFIISTVVMIVVLVAGIFIMDYFVNRDSGETAEQVAFTSESEVLAPAIEGNALAHGTEIDAITVADDAEGEAAVLDGDATAFITGTPPEITVHFASSPNDSVLQIVTTALQTQAMEDAVLDLGGDPDAFAAEITTAAPNVSLLEGDIEEFGPNYFLAMLVLALLLFGLINSGSIISMGVVEEKASRVVEILLATIKPSELFAGKVLGAGLIGLIQLLIYGAAAFGAITITGIFEGFDIPVGGQLLSMLMWFLLGFAAIGTLWGALSSLVSRQEDVGAVTGPMMFVVLIPFYVAMFLVPNSPDSVWTTNLSMAPILAPFVMPIRQVFGDVPAWEMAVAVGLNVAIVPIIVWVAAKVYHRAVLHTGSRMKLGDVFKKQAG